MVKILKIDVWKNSKRIFRGYFSYDKHIIETVNRLTKGDGLLVEWYVIEDNDNYYLQRLRKVLEKSE